MKQVIAFCVLLATTFNIAAQVKKVIKKPVSSTVVVSAPKIPQETAKVPSGPTKEQTVDFIKEYFTKDVRSGTTGAKIDGEKHFKSESATNFDVDFDEKLSRLIISYNYESRHSVFFANNSGNDKTSLYSKYKYIIDLKKIESINHYVIADRKYDINYVNIIFKTAPSNSIESFKSEMESYEGFVDGKAYSKNTKVGFDDVTLPATPMKESSIKIPIAYYVTDDPNFDHGAHNKKILQAFNHLRKLCGAPEPISFD